MNIQLPQKNSKHIITILALLSFMLVGYWYWHRNHYFPSTDNAYIQANIIKVSPLVTGDISAIYVEDHQTVRKGQPLFDIDARPFQAAVIRAQAELERAQQEVAADEQAIATAEATVNEQQANTILSEKNAYRVLTLASKGQISKADGDNAQAKLYISRAALAAAQSRLEQARKNLGQPGENNARIQRAKANLVAAKLDLEHAHVVSPADGTLINFNLRVGTTVFAQKPFALFSIIENNYWWTDANFKETELARIQVGQRATIKLDIYPDHTFKGLIVAISSGSGSAFSLLPAENATGNWVKVTQRFPVKVKIINPDPIYPLRVGASCEVTIDTTNTKQ